MGGSFFWAAVVQADCTKRQEECRPKRLFLGVWQEAPALAFGWCLAKRCRSSSCRWSDIGGWDTARVRSLECGIRGKAASHRFRCANPQSAKRETASRRSLWNPIRRLRQADASAVLTFRFRRHPSSPIRPAPVANSGNAAGKGTTPAASAGPAVLLRNSALNPLGFPPFC